MILNKDEHQLLDRFIDSHCADKHVKEEIKHSYHKIKQRLWEAIVYDYLVSHEKTIQCHDTGPDFIITNHTRKINIEAVAPRFDKQITEFQDTDNFESGIINTDNYLARWSTGLFDKSKKYKEYIDNNVISQNDINIIAISNTTSTDPLDFYCGGINSPPRILEYLYPINFQEILLNKKGKTEYASRINFKKNQNQKSTSVPTGVFQEESFQHISAVLTYDYHSTKDWILIHNHNAQNKLYKNELPCQQEWAAAPCKKGNTNYYLEKLQ